MKKLLIIVGLLVVLSAFASAESLKHYFVVDDTSHASDVIILMDIINNVKSELGENYETMRNSDISKEVLNYRITTFIYNGEALIIVGVNSSAEDVILATKITNYLKDKNIKLIQKLSSEITNNDLKKELPQKYIKKHYFITDNNSPASDVVLLTGIINKLEKEIGNNYITKLNSEIIINELEDRVSVFIYLNHALIIVGEHSLVDHVSLAAEISNMLSKEYGIFATSKLSSEIKNIDLTKEIGIIYCWDTDGNDVYTKGRVTWIDQGINNSSNYGKTYAYEDQCESPKKIKEYICVDNNTFQSVDLECTYDCAYGRCMEFNEQKGEMTPIQKARMELKKKLLERYAEEAYSKDKNITNDEILDNPQKPADYKEDYLSQPSTKEEKDDSIEQEDKSVPICQECRINETTCIPFGTRVEIDNITYFCDISKKIIEQRNNKQDCQNSYECLSNNCKSGICSAICEGCLDEDKACIPFSTRTVNKYCDIDHNFKNQRLEDTNCNNNYECSTNLCINSKCISPNLIQKIILWFQNLFG